MTAEIVNLRRARKQRARREADEAAQKSRVAFGRGKAERAVTEASQRLERKKLDAHRIEGAETGSEARD